MDYSPPKKEGFTLLELLIVIGILAILGAVVIFVLNPAETLRKTRDSSRISDLATIKTALGLYLTGTTTPQMARGNNTACKSSASAAYAAGDAIFYSGNTDIDNASTTDRLLDGSSTNDVPVASSTNTSAYRLVDGRGWIPVNLKSLASGSPIDSWPVDPSNTFVNGASAAATVTNEALVYRYLCEATTFTFEVDANLESVEFTSGSGNRENSDGGNNTSIYEVGTDLTLLGTGDNF